MIPIAIMGTVAIGFVTSWSYSIALFFSMNDLQQLFDTATLVPLLELFFQALGNRAGAVVLECLVVASGVLCLVACHTWQARLGWSFARDKVSFFWGWECEGHADSGAGHLGASVLRILQCCRQPYRCAPRGAYAQFLPSGGSWAALSGQLYSVQ